MITISQQLNNKVKKKPIEAVIDQLSASTTDETQVLVKYQNSPHASRKQRV